MTAIDRARWQEVRALFDEVVELEASQRTERLAAVADTDPDLHRAVEVLLRGDAEADARLARMDTVLSPQGSDSPAKTTRDVDPLGLTGRTISHFRVLEPLAVGGMGVVYRAEDTRLGRVVALKLPLPERCFGRDARERFVREGKAAGALDHPNVCAIHEVGESDDGYLFLAMTLYPGETLGARLHRDGPVPVAEALEIARAIARGLGAAHAAGIVHRDVKPANVMLVPDGGVKVLDFGLAKPGDVDLTASRAMMGTVSYMAPEQIRGTPADLRADLWALGVVLYEMLTGRRPFAGERDISIAHAIVHDEPARPRDLRADIPPAVEEVLKSLLQKDVERRPATALAVEADLAAAASGHAPSAGSWSSVGRRGMRSTRQMVGVVAGLLVIAVAGVATTLIMRARTAAVARPTTNAQAYDSYQRGREYDLRATSEENLRSAQSYYARAVALDSTFALARARLAITHVGLYSATNDRSPARLEQARAEAEAALRLQPNLADAHLARGFAWSAEGNSEKALREFETALAGLPNSAELHTAIANVLRSEGRWEEAVPRYERAAALDPRDVDVLRGLARTQSHLRRYEAAAHTWDRVIALAPDDHDAKVARGAVYLRWQGTPDTLAATLQRLPAEWDPEGTATWARFNVARIQRRPADALVTLAASRHAVSRDDMFYRPRALMQAQIYAQVGDRARARAYFDTARTQLEDSLAADPYSSRMRVALGLAYAGLGLARQATDQAHRAMASVLVAAGAEARTATMGGAAEICVHAGDLDGAFGLLTTLLGMPAGREVSVAMLRADPVWDPLRGDKRFAQLLARFSTKP